MDKDENSPEKPTPTESPSGESNLTPPTEATIESQRGKPRLEPGANTTGKISLWKRWGPLILAFVARVVAILGGLTTFLWTIALWDSYRPKITLAPGVTLDAKNPFCTVFVMENQGALPIQNVTYYGKCTGTDKKSDARGFINVQIIQQLKSLESYGFNLPHELVKTNEIPKGGHLILSFYTTYDPMFFGKRTDALYFVGVPDVEGIYQWFPTGHEDPRNIIVDTNLAQTIMDADSKKHKD